MWQNLFFPDFCWQKLFAGFFSGKTYFVCKKYFCHPVFLDGKKRFFPPASKNLPTLAFGSVHDVWCKNLGEKRQV